MHTQQQQQQRQAYSVTQLNDNQFWDDNGDMAIVIDSIIPFNTIPDKKTSSTTTTTIVVYVIIYQMIIRKSGLLFGKI
ncbi:hypothetical protein DERP_006415 [Dermatophagoides pteronyssinus]|uniref:Uncharacterized protein n=1 Tax=Dermatophagoides pteronyssinus TaxID=6956 RepID=A0ABQ8IQ57_DERPT|nr:hypothetical protein DERP_006415 [Dermatophagoides pteronyssinus]